MAQCRQPSRCNQRAISHASHLSQQHQFWLPMTRRSSLIPGIWREQSGLVCVGTRMRCTNRALVREQSGFVCVEARTRRINKSLQQEQRGLFCSTRCLNMILGQEQSGWVMVRPDQVMMHHHGPEARTKWLGSRLDQDEVR